MINRLGLLLGFFMIVSLNSIGQDRFSIIMNDQLLTQEKLSHQVFCLNKEDQFTIKYIYPENTDSLKHLITSIELWVQYELGRPFFIGALKQEKASPDGLIIFSLSDFDLGNKLPQTPKVLRSSFLIRNVLTVSGIRVVDTYIPSQEDGTFNFLMIPHCPE